MIPVIGADSAPGESKCKRTQMLKKEEAAMSKPAQPRKSPGMVGVLRICCLAASRRVSEVIRRSSRLLSTEMFFQLKVGGDKRFGLQTWRM